MFQVSKDPKLTQKQTFSMRRLLNLIVLILLAIMLSVITCKSNYLVIKTKFKFSFFSCKTWSRILKFRHQKSINIFSCLLKNFRYVTWWNSEIRKKKRAVREGKVYALALCKKRYINFLFWILQIPLSVKLLTSY